MKTLIYFNPHEREARDLRTTANRAPLDGILIHTSVKLVTHSFAQRGRWSRNFNPHEREARDISFISPVLSLFGF